MIKPEILTTDFLLWLLAAVGVIYGVMARRSPPLREAWRKVFYSKRGAVSAVVLGFFIVLALLDCMHYRPLQNSNDVVSVLDKLMSPIPTETEKTYSEPMAAFAYNKEELTLKDGKMIRDYPRLVYGGAHLSNPSEQIRLDRWLRFFQGIIVSVGFYSFIFLTTVVAASFMQKKIPLEIIKSWLQPEPKTFPWRAVWITLAIIIFLMITTLVMAHYYHVFGTNKIGEDVLYTTIKSIRTAVIIGTLTTLVTLPFALILGTFAGYFRGWIDDLIQYVYTTLSSIPSVLLIAAAVLMLQVYMANHPTAFSSSIARADIRLLALCVILGVTSWTSLCRLLRGETLKLREQEYVQAAITLGVPKVKIIARHIIPNLAHIVIIIIALDFSGLVLAEAVLSYVGVGVDPTTYSWGNMINQARLELAREPVVWWTLGGAFGFMFALVLFANVLADAIRDAFDPRLMVVE